MGLFGLVLFPSGLVLAIVGLWYGHEPSTLLGVAASLAGVWCLK